MPNAEVADLYISEQSEEAAMKGFNNSLFERLIGDRGVASVRTSLVRSFEIGAHTVLCPDHAPRAVPNGS